MLVCSQVGPVGKLFPTTGATVRFLPRVRSHVALQQPGPGESLPAHVTLVAETVGEDMHGESVGAGVRLAADGAGLGCPARQLHVKLLMARQV
jgi:hypothetical protein